jgi:hypothetical protein
MIKFSDIRKMPFLCCSFLVCPCIFLKTLRKITKKNSQDRHPPVTGSNPELLKHGAGGSHLVLEERTTLSVTQLMGGLCKV